MFNYKEDFFVEKKIKVSADKAWSQISEPASLTKWHPFMKKHTSKNWNGIGSKDQLTYYSGLVWDREVMDWIEGTGFDLKVTKNGKQESWAIWRISPVDSNSCVLRITGRVPYIKKLPFIIRWMLLEFKMKPVFCNYLENILMGFAYYMETGKQVDRNQFGSIPFFSK